MTELELLAGRELIEWVGKYHKQLTNNQLVGLLEAVKHFVLDYYSRSHSMDEVFREWREKNK